MDNPDLVGWLGTVRQTLKQDEVSTCGVREIHRVMLDVDAPISVPHASTRRTLPNPVSNDLATSTRIVEENIEIGVWVLAPAECNQWEEACNGVWKADFWSPRCAPPMRGVKG